MFAYICMLQFGQNRHLQTLIENRATLLKDLLFLQLKLELIFQQTVSVRQFFLLTLVKHYQQ